MTDNPRPVPISPSAMVDSVADWPLHRVVEHLRQKEKDDPARGGLETDCRLFCNSSIKFFTAVVDEVAAYYDVSRGKSSRWLSYHAIFIAREDTMLQRMRKSFDNIRRMALTADDPDLVDIVEAKINYSPFVSSVSRGSFYVHSSWVASEFNTLSRICAVSTCQVAQVFMIRSLLTSDLPALTGVLPRLVRESERWDIWMKHRLDVMDIAASMWGSR